MTRPFEKRCFIFFGSVGVQGMVVSKGWGLFIIQPYLYKGSHLKGPKQISLRVHQRKVKHFIIKLLAQPTHLFDAYAQDPGMPESIRYVAMTGAARNDYL